MYRKKPILFAMVFQHYLRLFYHRSSQVLWLLAMTRGSFFQNLIEAVPDVYCYLSQVSAHYNWQTTPGDGISETAVKTDFSKGGRRASVYGWACHPVIPGNHSVLLFPTATPEAVGDGSDIYPHLLELTSLRDAEREKNSKLRPPSPKMQFWGRLSVRSTLETVLGQQNAFAINK